MRGVIVDDEYYAREGLRLKLQEIGMEVVGMYESGEAFLAEARQIAADLIFLDIEMPKMNGLDVMVKLQVMGLAAKVIFVSAYSIYEAGAAKTGALDYIIKPVTKERLREAIRRVGHAEFDRDGSF